MFLADFLKIADGCKNFVFIGESGSGKTEGAMTCAVLLSEGRKKVHFFDMDQTKPLFRAREHEDMLEKHGITVHYQEQLLDLPTLVPAVRELLNDEDSIVVMDVGGNEQGAHMIGQFSDVVNGPLTKTFYVVNPYRVWSGSGKDISTSVQGILGGCRITKMDYVFNPNMGTGTDEADVTEGCKRLNAILDVKPAFIMAKRELAKAVEEKTGIPVLALEIFLRHPWNEMH